jgi:hypothetical protein
LEFKEWKGGRAINLRNYIKSYRGQVDLYRCSEIVYREYNKPIWFDGHKVTDTMRRMTGRPYGWQYIRQFIRRKMPVLRWLLPVDSSDQIRESYYHVCSSSVAYSFNVNGYDLVKNKSDFYVEPSDIARSPLLHYQFTLVGN